MKETFKTLMLTALLVFLPLSAQSAIVINAGEFKFTGDTYIGGNDVVGVGAESAGIGRILAITQGTDTIWESGDNGEFINFVFDDFTTNLFNPLGGGINFFQATGGFVNFFLTTNGSIFNVANAMLPTIAAITGDPLATSWLTTVAVGPTSGIIQPTSYAGNGFLNVTGGSAASMFDTNSRSDGNGGFVDLTFGLVGAQNTNPLVNDDYFYNTSADVQGAVRPVPTPAPLMLLATGLIGLGFMTKGKKIA
jgi:hypothetical protein